VEQLVAVFAENAQVLEYLMEHPLIGAVVDVLTIQTISKLS